MIFLFYGGVCTRHQSKNIFNVYYMIRFVQLYEVCELMFTKLFGALCDQICRSLDAHNHLKENSQGKG